MAVCRRSARIQAQRTGLDMFPVEIIVAIACADESGETAKVLSAVSKRYRDIMHNHYISPRVFLYRLTPTTLQGNITALCTVARWRHIHFALLFDAYPAYHTYINTGNTEVYHRISRQYRECGFYNIPEQFVARTWHPFKMTALMPEKTRVLLRPNINLIKLD